MKKKLTSVLLFLALSAGVVSAQTSKVTGKVIGEDGEPVIGASIIVKGTTVGTVTDFDGNFELEVPANGKQLVISYIGMKSQEVAATSNVNVKLLADTQNLDEVVVTAMGISKEKKALGYAVQDVKADELTKGANTSLSGALQGKVSGVEISPSSGMPGASSKITIRGSRSFTGDNTPLYVIDGMPVASTADVDTGSSVSGTDFASRAVDIDPNDIESINILKGQAASALYGMRATNGVIVITTKSGKGARKGKPQVAFNTSLSFDKVSTMPEYQKVYAQGTNGKYSPYASTSWGPLISELPNDPTYGGNTDNEFTKQYGKHEGMYYVPQRAAAGLDPWAQPQAYDNIKDFFNVGTTWSNSVNVAQAFDKGNYSFSIGNTTQDGIIPNTGMDRYNAKMSAEAQLHKNWSTGFTGTYVNSKISKQSSANNGILATVYGAPSSYDLAGIPSHVEGDPVCDYLKKYEDPRLNDFYSPNTDGSGETTALKYGDRPNSVAVTTRMISVAKLGPTDPVYFMSAAEVAFLQAEAYARLNDVAKAKVAYEQGVNYAFERWGYSAAEFVSEGAPYAFDSTDQNSMLTSILTQKWIASTRCQAWDAWFDINRTGIPVLGTKHVDEEGYIWGQLTPCIGSALAPGEYPRRLLYPKSSSDYNPNTPAVVPLAEKQWWHK